MSDIDDDENIFQSDYYYLIYALDRLSQDTKGQCKLGDNFNVASELQEEVLRGFSKVSQYPESGLSEPQKRLMQQLAEAVEAIPKIVLSGSRTREGSAHL